MEVIIRQTVVFAIVSLAAYYIGWQIGFGAARSAEQAVAAGQTMAFLVTGLTSVLHALTVRSRKNLYKYRVKDNPQLYISCGAMIVFFVLIAAVPPIASFFGLTALGWQQWLIVFALTLAPTLVAEYGKLWDAVRSRTAEKNRVAWNK